MESVVDQQLAWRMAVRILQLFQDYRSAFRSITSQARRRFESADWSQAEAASIDRIKLYKHLVDRAVATLERDASSLQPADWAVIKGYFAELIQEADDAALAKTAYNSIFRKLAGRSALDEARAFIQLGKGQQKQLSSNDLFHFKDIGSVEHMLLFVLSSYPFDVDFLDLTGDVALAAERMRHDIPTLRTRQPISVTMLRPVFYRNKGAYLIGHMTLGAHRFPLAFAIQRETSGLALDAVLWTERDLSLIFSFTRSYFMVDLASPAPFVAYLNTLMPNKKTAELYTSLGYFKHGKTVFIDELTQHLNRLTSEQNASVFEETPGIPGLVMEVFQLRSFQVVFKVIKDRFPASKKVTREGVRAAYELVKTHDRVGRMADTHEFFELRLPKSMFDNALLERMLAIASQSVSVEGEEVVLHHVYVERLMRPLNLYLAECNATDRQLVLEDFGEAIKQLASANIFPGDMLPKNFGVTRHGRVVFYDYDEICYLTEVNFRALPTDRPDQSQAAQESWLSVGDQDVFPEQFRVFLLPQGENRLEFWTRHPDLAEPDYWISVQGQIGDQEMVDFYPYRQAKRLRPDHSMTEEEAS